MKVSSQYIALINNMKSEHDKQISALMDKLKAAELQNKLPEVDVSGDGDSTSSEMNQQETIEIDSKDNGDNMSGLSIDSSDDDNELIMNNIKRKRRKQRKNKVPSETLEMHLNSPLRKSYRVSSPSANNGRRLTL